MSIAMLIILVAAALFFYYFVGMVIMLYYCDESNSDLAVWIEDMTNDSFAAFSGVVLMWPLLLVRIACVALWWLLRNLGGSKSILGGAGKFLINVVRMK